MIKTYNGELYIIPPAFEKEIRADEREKVIAKVANLKNEYTDACNMCTKTDCRACEINNFIEQLENIISNK